MLQYRWQVAQAIAEARFVAIVRSPDRALAHELVAALIEGGAEAVEVTMTTPGALSLLEEFRGQALLGVGTVLSAGQVSEAASVGARFIVTPNLDADVIRHAQRHGLATLVGCATPTEVVNALSAGADMVKLFPAGNLGPDFLRAVHGPLPWAPLVPTGGVSVDNAREWLDAGAVALGIGGKLCEGTPPEVVERVRELRRLLIDGSGVKA